MPFKPFTGWFLKFLPLHPLTSSSPCTPSNEGDIGVSSYFRTRHMRFNVPRASFNKTLSGLEITSHHFPMASVVSIPTPPSFICSGKHAWTHPNNKIEFWIYRLYYSLNLWSSSIQGILMPPKKPEIFRFFIYFLPFYNINSIRYSV